MTEQTENIINVRKPIKVLHFSDGVLEIFDDEDKEAKQEATVEEEVNENELSWAPWLRRKASHIGTNVINGLDYAGEKVANFLQITTPKYAYEIDQFKKMEAKKAREEQHENNWTASSALTADQPITTPPAPLSTNPIDMKV